MGAVDPRFAPFGAMIKIGKRDLYGHARIDAFQFTTNRAFYGVDVRHIQSDRPELCGMLLGECARYYEESHVRPIPTYHNYGAHEITNAFRHIQRGTHIGKLTVTIPDDNEQLPAVKGEPALGLSHDASYFLVGGLGGVGRSIASWFV